VKGQAYHSDATPGRGVDQSLQNALRQNRLWIRSNGRVGKEMDVRMLPSPGFADRDVSNIDFRDAPLRGLDFKNARLRDADFRGADLREVDFTDAKGLLPDNIAGTNLAGAILPANIEVFDDLTALEAASKNSQTLFITMLGACIYSWLTIATTTDSALLINNVSSPLPLISTLIPIVTFYYFTPPILLCLHVYFLLNLQNVWNLLAKLPAIFPDGVPLERKSSPWLLTDLVSFYFRHLRGRMTSLSHIQRALSVFLAWYLVPVTLLAFWLRYLPVRDFLGTIWQTLIVALSLLFATSLHGLAVSTLRMEIISRGSKAMRAVRRKRYAIRIGVTAVLAALLLFFANGAINGTWLADRELLTSPIWKNTGSTFVPWLAARTGISPLLKPNLAHLDVSTKPPSWSGKDEELDSVKGANLSYRDISFANCTGAFAANAHLVGAKLSGAEFTYADLRKSDLSRAVCNDASFAHARLSTARFGAAKMQGAQFYGAFLKKTIFTSDFLRARLGEANKKLSLLGFSSSNFSGAEFTYARMDGCDCRSTLFSKARFLVARICSTDFTGSDLEMAYFTAAIISDCDFELTKLSGSSFDGATLISVNFNRAELSDPNGKLSVVFTNATLRGVDFREASHIESAVFSGACFDSSTKWPDGFDPIKAGAKLDLGAPPPSPAEGAGCDH